jgi:hypothetical protein
MNSSDSDSPESTIDSVRELLLGDTIKQSRRELDAIERKTYARLADLRLEMGDRVDRVVRALSTVNQSLHKEADDRDQAIRDSSEEISTRTEDRLSALEAKIYTAMAELESKASAARAADNGNLIARLEDVAAQTQASVIALTEKFEQQLQAFGSRITSEVTEINEKILLARIENGEHLDAAESRLADDLGELRCDFAKSSVQMRQEITRRAGETQAIIAHSEVNTKATLDNELRNFEERKVSRSDFSSLLQELATRLDEPAMVGLGGDAGAKEADQTSGHAVDK